jgi:hypothetical protein
MRKMIKTIIDSNIQSSLYGRKAFWLSWLHKEGYRVPYSVFLNKHTDIKTIISESSFIEDLNVFKNDSGMYEVAVRSSGTIEDGKSKSFAGHFLTKLGKFKIKDLFKSIDEVKLSSVDATTNQKIAVIIQKLVIPSFSGVIFSSDPLSLSKEETPVSFVKGFGDRLMSGKENAVNFMIESEDLHFVKIKNRPKIIDSINNQIIELYSIAKAIENKLKFPVDIEWCIENDSGNLYILQCRPITGFHRKSGSLIKISKKHFESIPKIVTSSKKVQLRMIAEKNNVKISDAYVLSLYLGSKAQNVCMNKIKNDELCDSYSLVLINPENVGGKVMRLFAHKPDYHISYNPDENYAIDDLFQKKLQQLVSAGLNKTWNPCVIIQGIYNPLYTGILKRIERGYIVEIARGHFVPKGIVETSWYFLNNQYEIVDKNEPRQSFMYEIKCGREKKLRIDEFTKLEPRIIVKVVQSLEKILETGDEYIEFGLINKNRKLIPYVIDKIVTALEDRIDENMISNNIISYGNIEGRVKHVSNSSLKNSLNMHYHDVKESRLKIESNTIFVYKMPDIGLMKIVNKYDNKKIGFIFRDGSCLSHFSIILRERRIPAVIYKNIEDLLENETVEIGQGIANNSTVLRLSK